PPSIHRPPLRAPSFACLPASPSHPTDSRLTPNPFVLILPHFMLVRDPREISDSIVSAVLDFCRRADRPTTAEEVRLALARLGSDREREILRLAASEPPARPLSPHAFVDWIQGMPPAQAAALEEAGAYQAIAREAAAQAIDLQL